MFQSCACWESQAWERCHEGTVPTSCGPGVSEGVLVATLLQGWGISLCLDNSI